jgi:SanA protein
MSDSIVRNKEVFGQNSITVILQPFHNERVIRIAIRKGIYAIGCNSERVGAKDGMKEQIRLGENYARFDFGKTPNYLGKPIKTE